METHQGRLRCQWNTATTGATVSQIELWGASAGSDVLGLSVNGNGLVTIPGTLTTGNVGIGTAVGGVTSLFIIPAVASNLGILLRGTVSQCGDLLVLQDNSHAVLANFTAGGNLGIGVGAGGAVSLGVKGRVATDIVVQVRGFTSQTGDLTQWFDTTNTNVTSVGANGNLGVGVTGQGATTLAVKALSDSTKGFLVRAFSGTQSGNLTEWQASDGTLQTAVAANGRDFVLDTVTGTKIGTSASQKLACSKSAPRQQA